MSLQIVVAGIIAVVVMGLVATTAIYRGNAIAAEAETRQARADLATAKSINDANQKTIAQMQDNAKLKDRVLTELASEVATINENVAATTKAIGDLRDANDGIRVYLAGLVPVDLGVQLNK